MPSDAARRKADFAPADVEVEKRGDGSILFRSPRPLGAYGHRMGELIDRAAATVPDRCFLAERCDGGWRRMSYASLRDQVRRAASALLRLGTMSDRPLAVLSDNSIEVAVITLAAIYAGITVVPVSPAYAKLSRTLERLGIFIKATNPAVVYASDPAIYGRALASGLPDDALVLVEKPDKDRTDWLRFADFMAGEVDEDTLAAAVARIDRNTLAKIMFTSGSTGHPKGVLMTHGMLLAHTQALAECWPFMDRDPPVLLNWLPWSHSFGGNAVFFMVLNHMGTLYIDDGRPVPELIGRTVENLRSVSPTIMKSVPREYGLLLPYLEADAELARTFFRDLKLVFYAAADMPPPVWQRIEALAAKYCEHPPYFTSAWGMSENIATSTLVHFPIEQAGFIGLPVPGTTIKLVPADGKMELRLRGPALTPGYLGRPDLTRAALDEEGFYCSGDAGRLVDPENPALGFAYDGRIGENFKLSSGRWIFVGQTRVRAVADGEPIVDDVVVAAPARDEAGLLIFLNIPACRALSPELLSAGIEELARAPEVRDRVREMLRKVSADPALSLIVRRAMILTEPASIDGHETSDKGYLNQRGILARRQAIVDRLYDDGDPDVIMIEHGAVNETRVASTGLKQPAKPADD